RSYKFIQLFLKLFCRHFKLERNVFYNSHQIGGCDRSWVYFAYGHDLIPLLWMKKPNRALHIQVVQGASDLAKGFGAYVDCSRWSCCWSGPTGSECSAGPCLSPRGASHRSGTVQDHSFTKPSTMRPFRVVSTQW